MKVNESNEERKEGFEINEPVLDPIQYTGSYQDS